MEPLDSRLEYASIEELGAVCHQCNGGCNCLGAYREVVVRKGCEPVTLNQGVSEFNTVSKALFPGASLDEYDVTEHRLDLAPNRDGKVDAIEDDLTTQCICTQPIRYGFMLTHGSSDRHVIIGADCAERARRGLGEKCKQNRKRKRCSVCKDPTDLRGKKAKVEGGPMCKTCYSEKLKRDELEKERLLLEIKEKKLREIKALRAAEGDRLSRCACGRRKNKKYTGVYWPQCYVCANKPE